MSCLIAIPLPATHHESSDPLLATGHRDVRSVNKAIYGRCDPDYPSRQNIPLASLKAASLRSLFQPDCRNAKAPTAKFSQFRCLDLLA